MKLKAKILIGLLAVLLVGAGWLGWSAANAALQARAALAALNRLQAAAGNPSLEAAPALRADLALLEARLHGTQRAARPFLWLAPKLGWLPGYGPEIAAAPALLEMGVQLTEAGRIGADALMPAVDLLMAGGGLNLLPDLAQTLQAAGPQLTGVAARLAVAEGQRATIRGPLDPRLEARLGQLDRLLPLARDGIALSQAAPGLLGMSGTRSYLVLAQNSHELRATGGFISGVGYVTLENGRVSALNVADSYSADNWSQPHPTPPRPLMEQLGVQLWVVRDANWSPDFTEATDVARALYAQDQGVFTHGAIAVDLEAVRLLVGVLGPLQVEGIEESITGANTIDWMKRAWQAPITAEADITSEQRRDWYLNRKDFMGELLGALLGRLERGSDLDLAALSQALTRMLDQRHLQISMDDPTVAALLARQGWDGGLRPRAGSDFLAVVDTNVGFNKVNQVVQPALTYRVAAGDGGLEATLVISYTHTAPAGSEPNCVRSPRYGDSYDEMTQRCYWNYLRVYAPGGSELLAAGGLQQVSAEPGERGTTVFAGDFVALPGETYTVTLRYRLPADLSAAPYRLFVRKQAGALAPPLFVSAPGCEWSSDLRVDRAFTCGDADQ